MKILYRSGYAADIIATQGVIFDNFQLLELDRFWMPVRQATDK